MDEESIKYFKYKNYSNSGMFKILFSNSLRKKYLGKINNELLNIITNLAKSDNKIDVSTMMAYTCFENIDNTVEISEFENKFNVLKYFVKKNLRITSFLFPKSTVYYRRLRQNAACNPGEGGLDEKDFICGCSCISNHKLLTK